MLSERHEKSRQIPDDDVLKYGNGYLVHSQTTKGVFYHVKRTAEECSCIDRCFCCPDLCPHIFRCGCPYKYTICKHVHKVYTCLQNGKNLLEVQETDEENFEAEIMVSSDSMEAEGERLFPCQDSFNLNTTASTIIYCIMCFKLDFSLGVREFPTVENESLQSGKTLEEGLSKSLNITEPEGKRRKRT